MNEVYLTKKGYKELMEQLEFLKGPRRREISKAIGEAIAHGDISENAEYDSAKDAQGMNEKRIAELEEKLSRARVIEYENISSDEVLIGATVRLKDLNTAEEFEYILVSEMEADYESGKISISSPVGSALLNHKENDIVEIKIPAGALKYQVLKISRPE